MKITLIQMKSNGTKKENEEKALNFLKEASKENPDIICLSELFLSCGKEFENGKVNIEEIKVFQSFAKNNAVNLILGSVALISNNPSKTTNTCFVIDRNGNIIKEMGKEEGLLTVELDLEKQVKYRKEFPILEQM